MGALMAAAFALMFSPLEKVRHLIRRLTFAGHLSRGRANAAPGAPRPSSVIRRASVRAFEAASSEPSIRTSPRCNAS